MRKIKVLSKHHSWEMLFQLILLAMVFIFYAFERHNGRINTQITPYHIASFLNYILAAGFISYFLLPKFLYQKKYLIFGIVTLAVVAVVIFIDEAILEQIYFPTTRGTKFLGVFINLASTLPILTILVGFKFAWDALTKQQQLEKLQSLVKESELQFLKSQINPHFLFNNLNNLYAYALENSPKTPTLILELSGVLRYMLYECQEEFVPLQKEIDQLAHFINLSQLQIEDRGTVQYTTNGINPTYKIAPLLLTVFVENAFKHSLSSQCNDINIAINIDLLNHGELHFKCQNNFSTNTNTEHLSKGIGLENVKKRLELIYPNQFDLIIKNSANTYSVWLKLLLQKA